MRDLGQLLTTDEPAWPIIAEWLRQTRHLVETLAPSALGRGEALLRSQVTVQSPLGAIIYETGGVLVDHGWLRLLGSGHPRLPRTLPDWNRGRSTDAQGRGKGFYLVADDVLGGFFAMDGGAFGDGKGDVYYFAPDTLRWEPTRLTYFEFVHWCLTGDVADFYAPYRWPHWEQDALATPGDGGILANPFLCAEGPPLAQRERSRVPIAELYNAYVEELPKRLAEFKTRPRSTERVPR